MSIIPASVATSYTVSASHSVDDLLREINTELNDFVDKSATSTSYTKNGLDLTETRFTLIEDAFQSRGFVVTSTSVDSKIVDITIDWSTPETTTIPTSPFSILATDALNRTYVLKRYIANINSIVKRAADNNSDNTLVILKNLSTDHRTNLENLLTSAGYTFDFTSLNDDLTKLRLSWPAS